MRMRLAHMSPMCCVVSIDGLREASMPDGGGMGMWALFPASGRTPWGAGRLSVRFSTLHANNQIHASRFQLLCLATA